MKIVLLHYIFLFRSQSIFCNVLSSEYNHSAFLDATEKYQFFWTVDKSAKKISFAVEVKTSGWVGFGFSAGLAGKMEGADMVVGWISADGKAHSSDRHGTGHVVPVRDAKDDFTLKAGEEKNGITILKFERHFDTCDPQDIKIKGGTMKLIFAYGTADPLGNQDITYHGANNKGSRSMNLLTSVKNSPPPADAKYFDILAPNVAVPSTDTTYWCRVFRIPENITTKQHLIQIDPIIQSGHEGLVHHILIYECNDVPQHVNYTGNCYGNPSMPTELQDCIGRTTVYAWAIGSTGFKLPSHVGIPLGTSDTFRYVAMEVHYDNPQMSSSYVDSSGLRFYYTSNLRQYDAATLNTGFMVSNFQIVPPNTTDWITVGTCPKNLTEKISSNLPSKDLKIFAALPHAHLLGTSIWTNVIHKDGKKEEVIRDDTYDFNFQQTHLLGKEISLKPGDEIVTACKYDSSQRTEATTGGQASKEEMCLDFLLYYPKQDNFKTCQSTANAQPFYQKYAKNGNNWQGVSWNSSMVQELMAVYNQSIVQAQLIGAKGNSVAGGIYPVTNLGTLPILPPNHPCKQWPPVDNNSSALRKSDGSYMVSAIFMSIFLFLRE